MTPGEVREVDGVCDRLAARYPTAPPEVIKAAVTVAWADFRAAKIREFVPVLVEREAREKLAALV